MRIRKKQQQEIDFLVHRLNSDRNTYAKCEARRLGLPEPVEVYTPTQQDIEEYINATVHGKGKLSSGALGGNANNKLFDSKRGLDIAVKMWTKGIRDGLFLWDEYLEGYENSPHLPYIQKVVGSIVKGIDFGQFDPDDTNHLIRVCNHLRQEALQEDRK